MADSTATRISLHDMPETIPEESMQPTASINSQSPEVMEVFVEEEEKTSVVQTMHEFLQRTCITHATFEALREADGMLEEVLSEEDMQYWQQVYHEAAAASHEDMPQLRLLSELQRQHSERWQEGVDLRFRVAQVHNPFALYLSRRRLLAEQRLRRLQLMRERLAGAALAELATVQRWLNTAAEIFPTGGSAHKSDAQRISETLLEGYGLSRSTGCAGARSLWSLAASLWALGAYAKAELEMLPPATWTKGPYCGAVRIERICSLAPSAIEDEKPEKTRRRLEPSLPPWGRDGDPPPMMRLKLGAKIASASNNILRSI